MFIETAYVPEAFLPVKRARRRTVLLFGAGKRCCEDRVEAEAVEVSDDFYFVAFDLEIRKLL